MEKDRSFRSKCYLTLIASEQRHANFLFEIAHLPADPRLGDVQLPRGGRKAAMLSNSAEVSEVTQFHT